MVCFDRLSVGETSLIDSEPFSISLVRVAAHIDTFILWPVPLILEFNTDSSNNFIALSPSKSSLFDLLYANENDSQ